MWEGDGVTLWEGEVNTQCGKEVASLSVGGGWRHSVLEGGGVTQCGKEMASFSCS